MSEIKRTMSEWIRLDLEERKLRAKVRQSMALCNQPKRPPVVLASLRPAAAAKATAVTPPKPDLRPPAELPDNPTLEDIARQLGISVEELQQASGSLSMERLMSLMGAETPDQLVEKLGLIIGNGPKGLTRFERVRVAVAKVRLAGRNVGKLFAIERAKANRAAAIKAHRMRAKLRG